MEILIVLALIGVCIIFIEKNRSLAERLSRLESEIRQIRNATGLPRPVTEEGVETAMPALKAQSEAAQAAPIAPTKTVPSSMHRPGASEPSMAPTSLFQRFQEEKWEVLIGEKWLNRIGAFALILGVGFFLKYAFDNNWITETTRVLIGAVTGIGLILYGAHSHKKGLQVFAQGLVGAGIPILYLSVYAAFNFYHLVSQSAAFVLMSSVTVLAFLQALKYDSLAISLLGWAGGFVTPVLLNTGQNNEVGLFSYIVLLDIWIIGVLVKNDSWIILEALTPAATYLTYIAWYQKYYSPDSLSMTVLFLSIFWGLFCLLDYHRSLRSTDRFSEIRHAIAALNAAFYYQGMYVMINPQHHAWTGLVTLMIGMVYLSGGLAVKFRRMDAVTIHARYTLIAIALLFLATAIQFSSFTTVVVWSLEALILVWCGLHWKLGYVWKTALGLFGLTFLKLIFTKGALSYFPIDTFTPILNQRFLVFATLAATLGVGAVLFKHLHDKQAAEIRAALYTGCFITILILSTVEARDFFGKAIFLLRDTAGSFDRYHQINHLENLRELAHSGIWLFWSILLMGFGIWRQIRGIRIGAIVLSGLSIIKIFIYDLSFLDTLYRIFVFVGLGLVLLTVSYLYQRYKAVFS